MYVYSVAGLYINIFYLNNLNKSYLFGIYALVERVFVSYLFKIDRNTI